MEKWKEQYVDHDIALKLYELGANIECSAYFIEVFGKPVVLIYSASLNNGVLYTNKELVAASNTFVKAVAAPLWQQVIDWLDEKEVYINFNVEPNDYSFRINSWFDCVVSHSPSYGNRKSCIKAAILMALPIVENKK